MYALMHFPVPLCQRALDSDCAKWIMMVPLKRLWIAVLSGLIILSYTYSGWACPFELPTVQVVVKGHDLTIELATTPEARTCGLSLRDSLPANRGMLFVYAEPEILTFWMKNTRMPLSIAFIDAAGRVVSIQKMNPFPDHNGLRVARPGALCPGSQPGLVRRKWRGRRRCRRIQPADHAEYQIEVVTIVEINIHRKAQRARSLLFFMFSAERPENINMNLSVSSESRASGYERAVSLSEHQ